VGGFGSVRCARGGVQGVLIPTVNPARGQGGGLWVVETLISSFVPSLAVGAYWDGGVMITDHGSLPCPLPGGRGLLDGNSMGLG